MFLYSEIVTVSKYLHKFGQSFKGLDHMVIFQPFNCRRGLFSIRIVSTNVSTVNLLLFGGK